jgi:hypothetical protein
VKLAKAIDDLKNPDSHAGPHAVRLEAVNLVEDLKEGIFADLFGGLLVSDQAVTGFENTGFVAGDQFPESVETLGNFTLALFDEFEFIQPVKLRSRVHKRLGGGHF